MNDKLFNGIETAPPSVVKRAARDFAAALAETEQFKALEQAAERFRRDKTAQQAMAAYQEKQREWHPLKILNS